MIEIKGNLWTYPADIRVITTNGTVKKDGTCVMGRGCALEAKKKFPGIDNRLGESIQIWGNHVTYLLGNIYSFPVKHNWYEKADLKLIKQSADELLDIIESDHDARESVVVLPRPGCGNGGLKWEEVQPILAPILDDRFHVITF